MNLALSEEHIALRDSLTRLLARHYDPSKRCRYLEEGCDPNVWTHFAELGLLSLYDPEIDPVLAMVATEALGAALVLEPFVETVLLCGRSIAAHGTADAKAYWLPRIEGGEAQLAFAHMEAGARQEPLAVDTRATPHRDGWLLNGAKILVAHGDASDGLLVSARISGEPADRTGVCAFLLDGQAPGIQRHSYRLQDGRPAADITLADAFVPGSAIIGEVGGAAAIVEELRCHAIAAQAAEAAGVMQAMHALTLEYVKVRKQFGTTLGSFQVVQHKLVDMLIELEQVRSMACYAYSTLTGTDAGARLTASSAVKVQVARSARALSQQAVQLHGGMGIAMENPVAHQFLRLMTLEREFGDASYHLHTLAARPTLPALAVID